MSDSNAIIRDESQELILVFAFRYAMGRSTYCVEFVVNEIINAWPLLSEESRGLYKKEIGHAITYGMAGMDMDVKQWKNILEL